MKAGPLVASGLVHVGVLWVLVAMEREPAGAGGDDRGLIQFEPVSAIEPEPEQEPEVEQEQEPAPEANPEPVYMPASKSGGDWGGARLPLEPQQQQAPNPAPSRGSEPTQQAPQP